jgi:hypothetical protein
MLPVKQLRSELQSQFAIALRVSKVAGEPGHLAALPLRSEIRTQPPRFQTGKEGVI